MTKRVLCLVLLASCVPLMAEAGPKREPIAVFVGVVPPTSVFIDERDLATADSVGDIQREFNRSSEIRIVESEREADLVLRVLGRRVETDEVGSYMAATPYGVDTGKRFRAGYALYTRIEIDNYIKPLTSYQPAMAWRDCSREIAQQLHKWVKTNRETLLARRKQAAR